MSVVRENASVNERRPTDQQTHTLRRALYVYSVSAVLPPCKLSRYERPISID